MSKQSETKATQKYVTNPVPMTCGNCQHRRFQMRLPKWMEESNLRRQKEIDAGVRKFDTVYFFAEGQRVEKNNRCGIGGFAVAKTATCALFDMKLL